jgi:hypothetical protein
MEKLDTEKLAWFDKTLAIKLNELIDQNERIKEAIRFLALLPNEKGIDGKENLNAVNSILKE